MPARIEHDQLDRPADASCDGIDLRARTILIIVTLDQERRNRNPIKILFDVPRTELGAQP